MGVEPKLLAEEVHDVRDEVPVGVVEDVLECRGHGVRAEVAPEDARGL